MSPTDPTYPIPAGWERCGSTDKGYPIITDGNLRKIIGEDGNLLNVGNPGNKGSNGRPPERIRVRATQGADDLVDDVIESTRMQLADAKNPDLSPDRRQRAHAEGVRGFKGLVEAGPGTKVTNVVEAPELLEVFSSSLESEGLSPEVQVRILERVKAHLA